MIFSATNYQGIQGIKDPLVKLVNLTMGSDEIIKSKLHFYVRSPGIMDPAVESMIMSGYDEQMKEQRWHHTDY